MFANLVRLALAAEFCAWAVLGAWLGAGPIAIVAGTLAAAAAVRLLVVAASFLLSWRARSPRGPADRLGPVAAAALLAGEWRAMLLNNFFWIPFEGAALRADPPLVPDARVPVILVHGYFSNRGTICALAAALDGAGVAPVFVPSLPFVLAPIETFAQRLERILREVTGATGQPRAILVCHSMGGLIARAYLRRHGAARVAGVITLGSPHHGTALAPLGAGENGRQMRLGSAFLGELEEAERREGAACPVLSIYTVHDNLVAPQDSSRLERARNEAIAGVGHLAMLLDARVHRAVVAEIGRLRAGTGPGA